MPSRPHSYNSQNTGTSDLSNAPAQGMFQSRPFVMQPQVTEKSQEQPDLKVSLMRAERYGHHLGQIQAASVSVPTAVQPKMGTGQPIQLATVKTKRLQAMGKTPGKKTIHGQAVLKRWHGKNKARYNGKGNPDYKKTNEWEVHVKTKDGVRHWAKLDQKIAMGHKLGAVDYWEKGAKEHIKNKPKYVDRYKGYEKPGYKTGFKSSQVRKFMLNPTNYRFELGSVNSSQGAKDKAAGHLYKSLPPKQSWLT